MPPIVPITKIPLRKAGAVAPGAQSSTPLFSADDRLDFVREFARYLFGSVPATSRTL